MAPRPAVRTMQGTFCTMGPRSVVVGSVVAKHPQEVAFVEHDDVVEALPTDRADQALAICVLPG